MFLQLFKKNRPYVIFLVPVLALSLWGLTIFDSDRTLLFNSQTSYIYDIIFGLFKGNRTLLIISGLACVIIQAFILIQLNFKYIFIEEKTYLPSVFFIIYSSLFYQFHYLHPLLLANFFMLLAINRSFVYGKEKNKFRRYFESGFFIGLGSLIYPYFTVFIVIIWIVLFVLRPSFNWREWFASVLGMLTPIIIYFSVLFLSDNFQIIYNHINLYTFSKTPNINFGLYSKIAFGVLAFILIISVLRGIGIARVKKISLRKYLSVFLRILIILIPAFYIPGVSYELITVLAIPISIIQTLFFVDIKNKWIAEVTFLLVLIPSFVILFLG